MGEVNAAILALQFHVDLWQTQIGPLVSKVGSYLRVSLHFNVVLGDEAFLPIQLCLVPVLVAFFIQNLKTQNRGNRVGLKSQKWL